MTQEARASVLVQLLGISNTVQHKLIARYASFQALLTASVMEETGLPELAAFIKKPDAWWDKTNAILELCRKQDIGLLPITNQHFPPLLREISAPPPLLFYQGNPASLDLPQVAIVGSRQATVSGKKQALQFAKELAANGITITSGMATGIDAAAHQGAMQGGNTIAVLGTGLDLVYPKRHAQLRQQILDKQGTLLSEFLPGTPPLAKNFPRRNRIISGLSMGVLVIEAAIRSGSLISARYALQQGREVFAVPGSIHNPLSRGCHQLIREGATLVETTEQIIMELDGFLALKCEQLTPENKMGEQVESSDLEKRVLHALGFDQTDIDTLVYRTQLPVAQLNQVLLDLELAGKVSLENGLIYRTA